MFEMAESVYGKLQATSRKLNFSLEFRVFDTQDSHLSWSTWREESVFNVKTTAHSYKVRDKEWNQSFTFSQEN